MNRLIWVVLAIALIALCLCFEVAEVFHFVSLDPKAHESTIKEADSTNLTYDDTFNKLNELDNESLPDQNKTGVIQIATNRSNHESTNATQKVETAGLPSNREHFGRLRYFSEEVPIDVMIRRMNIANVHMGCQISAWVYFGFESKFRRLNECRDAMNDRLEGRLLIPEKMEPFDTVYVPFYKLEHFVNNTLANITTRFVLISGQAIKVDPFPRFVFDAILQHPFVNKWFLQNVPMFASYNPGHRRIRSWPYGIHWNTHNRLLPEMITDFNGTNVTKDNFIYVGYVSKETNKRARRFVPSGDKVPKDEYMRRLHKSQYVISPDGDRPECYRHYEAIALGTVPITQMDRGYYRHFDPAPVVYGTRMYNVTKLEETLPKFPAVNRRLIFAEYWMEYVEKIVKRPVRWWDPLLDDFGYLYNITARVKEEAATVSGDPSMFDNLVIPPRLFCEGCSI